MTATTALIWKEWRESQAYLWIGIGVCLALPLIAALEYTIQFHRRFQVQITTVSFYFASILAIFTAVAATCRDLSGNVRYFWQATPTTLRRWFTIKFAVGFVLIWLSVMLSLPAQALTLSPVADFAWLFSFYLLAIYSVSFAAGCVLRRTSHAAVVGLIAWLFIWFIPFLVPVLPDLGTFDDPLMTFGSHTISQLLFMSEAVIIAAVSITISILAVNRNWVIESGRKGIYATIAAALIILFGSAALSVGGNLPVVAKVSLSARFINPVWVNGNNGVVAISEAYPEPPTCYRVAIGAHTLKVGGALRSPQGGYRRAQLSAATTLRDQSIVRYDLYREQKRAGTPDGPLLLHINRIDPTGDCVETKVSPFRFADDNLGADFNYSSLCNLWKNRLFVSISLYQLPPSGPQPPILRGSKDAPRTSTLNRDYMFDIDEPMSPKLVSDQGWSNASRWRPMAHDNQQVIILLPPFPGLSAKERLYCLYPELQEQHDELYREFDEVPALYKLSSIDPQYAVLKLESAYRPGRLSTLFMPGNDHVYGNYRNGLIYLQRYSSGGSIIRPDLIVLDPHRGSTMKEIAHFSQEIYTFPLILDDGRILIGGQKSLCLVAAPKRR